MNCRAKPDQPPCATAASSVFPARRHTDRPINVQPLQTSQQRSAPISFYHLIGFNTKTRWTSAPASPSRSLAQTRPKATGNPRPPPSPTCAPPSTSLSQPTRSLSAAASQVLPLLGTSYRTQTQNPAAFSCLSPDRSAQAPPAGTVPFPSLTSPILHDTDFNKGVTLKQLPTAAFSTVSSTASTFTPFRRRQGSLVHRSTPTLHNSPRTLQAPLQTP